MPFHILIPLLVRSFEREGGEKKKEREKIDSGGRKREDPMVCLFPIFCPHEEACERRRRGEGKKGGEELSLEKGRGETRRPKSSVSFRIERLAYDFCRSNGRTEKGKKMRRALRTSEGRTSSVVAREGVRVKQGRGKKKGRGGEGTIQKTREGEAEKESSRFFIFRGMGRKKEKKKKKERGGKVDWTIVVLLSVTGPTMNRDRTPMREGKKRKKKDEKGGGGRKSGLIPFSPSQPGG